ncbi:MAG: YceI family protein, partial [Gemmatimonadaceae bacterium]
EAPEGLTNTMRLAGSGEPGARLTVTGSVYYADGKSPASNVLIYAYHTNAAGVYARQSEQRGNGQRHGALRGWLRSDALGHYRIETIKPGPYPGRPDPAHIHLTVKPPGGDEQYIDVIEFDDDTRLTAQLRKGAEGRGGSGIVVLRDSAGMLRATRDIILKQSAPTKTGASKLPLARTAVLRMLAVSKADTQSIIPIDVRASVVRWKGTKFGGRGSHEGIVRLASGAMRRCGPSMCGGTFEIDMTTVEVTDIPLTDPVPRDRLTEHLKSDDFFSTVRYPRARFVMEAATAGPSGSSPTATQYAVRGALTLRTTTQPVHFPATVTSCGAATCVDASVMIDRRRWGIAYRYDPIRNLIVDDSIAIGIHLVVPNTSAPNSASPNASSRATNARAY